MKSQGSNVRHLYVHIPFCAVKCDYCAFYSEPAQETRVERLLAALEREIEKVAARLKPETIFFGGGTPSILTERQFERLLSHLRGCIPILGSRITNHESRVTSPDFEWTIEMNPATVSLEKARLLRAFGVNRASLGVQSFDDELLRRLGRVHTAAMALESIATLREAGFVNLNLDFIFAIPGQTPTQWEPTLRRAIALEPQHLSTYELTYEDDTPLFRRLQARGVARLDEATATAMYERMLELTAEAGFRQYEISNIARPGRECRHNLNAWRGGDYIGVGPSACGYVDGWRYRNVADIDAYIARIERGESPAEHAEKLSPRARAGELAAFALRMNEGVAAAAFERQTGFRLEQLWPDALPELAGQKLVEWDGERLRLTPRGRLLADTVAEAFIIVDKAETSSHHPAYAD
ncbi:MAG: radical SAM family heme chaperone HemW [Verrucomicrobia bacterium]|nr:radical SAM family heme chaperone HemW [Verrucomicrobiota bacterium]